MKHFFTLTVLLFTAHMAFAQKGKNELITYKAQDSTIFTVGDTIQFGMGSSPNGTFKYIYTVKTFTSNGQYWGQSLNGKRATIESIKKGGDERMGYTIYFGFRYGSILSGINVESAIASGELITPNSKKKMEKKDTPIIIQQNTVSVADELKKLKELLDAKVLTQEEYDIQKKKLLEK